MTLYRHFASKDDLIAAYLERSNAEFLAWLEDAIAVVDEPRAGLVAAFDAVGKLATSARIASAARSRARHPSSRRWNIRATGWRSTTSAPSATGSPSWLAMQGCVIPMAWPLSSSYSWTARGSPLGCSGGQPRQIRRRGGAGTHRRPCERWLMSDAGGPLDAR